MTKPAPTRTSRPSSPRVLVTVGTDHHPFDRLIKWVNDWIEQQPEQIGGFYVQWGTASILPVCEGSPFLTTEQLDSLLDAADVVICHGGPGLIADAWSRGIAPIVVPRRKRLGEVVDDHQVDFCAKLAELGRVHLASTPIELAAFLDEGIGEEAQRHKRAEISSRDSDVEAAVARFAALVDELMHRPRRRLLPLRLWRSGVAGRGRRSQTDIRPGPAGDNQAAGLYVPELPTIWRAGGAPARLGLARVPEEERE